MSDHLRTPPHSIEAEQAVISAVMTAPVVFDSVSYIDPADFYTEHHRRIWAAFKASERNRDIVSLFDLTKDAGERLYLGELLRNSVTAGNATYYAQIVRERSTLRKLIAACNTISASAFTMHANDAIATAARMLESVTANATLGSGPKHIKDLGANWYAALRERIDAGGKLVGMSTGFDCLDQRWGGMRGGQMIVIAGRPKRGKSTLAANIAQHVANTRAALIFNMEMGANEIIDRAIAHEGSIGISAIRNGTLDVEHLERLGDVWLQTSGKHLYIDDTPSQTIDSIRMNARAFAKQHGQSLIVIDYLQLIRGTGSNYERVSEISRGIKLLAKETDCPVIVVVQMNRAIDGANRKPILSDLRDSGAIEQDADIVTFCHQDDDEQDFSEIITRANRSGEAGTDYLRREFGVARFADMPSGWSPAIPEKKQGSGRGFR